MLHDWLRRAYVAGPSPRNLRAIPCYAKAGFCAPGEVVTPDGPALPMVRERDA
ncbi:hypothetical protein [Variovorax sp. Root473]|jgi:hypothetical protein|uniref:hypothetical protein n=1 Tax=Variovorax sp. Root473 TaxID=1736541 RepID=UPI000ACCAC00